jgi:hypothetical protein
MSFCHSLAHTLETRSDIMAFGRTFALLLAVLLLAAAQTAPPQQAGAATPPEAPAGAAVSPGATSQPPVAAGATPQPSAAAQRSFWPRRYCRERVMVANAKPACQGALTFCTSFVEACKDSKFNRETEKPCHDQAVWVQNFAEQNPTCTA